MTTHAEIHSPVGVQELYQDDPRLQAALALKFEPSELHEFDMADRSAGQMMGKLLAFLFCVLLFLMAGVNIWMIENATPVTEGIKPVVEDAGEMHH